MPKVKLFLDSSALFAGIVSPNGAARVLLMLGETGQVVLMVSEQVIAETERAVARKIPRALNEVRQAILRSGVLIQLDPPAELVQAHLGWMSHTADVPILVAAMRAKVDYLVTLNRKHFIDDPQVAVISGLRIGTPSDALAWVRGQLGYLGSL
jgi:predicted nucleic acid-binding protein